MEHWTTFDNVQISNVKQGSDEWLNLRKNILTASDFAAAAGYSKFNTPLEIALDRSNLYNKKFDDISLQRMKHGNDTEQIARNYYEQYSQNKVLEVGLARNPLYPYLGASVDGLINDGIIEIKCPLKMYQPLITKHNQLNYPIADPNNYNPIEYKHIYPTHFAQMQGGMAIYDRKYCDYIVYTNEMVYIERIPFLIDYWKILLNKLNDFVENLLLPAIKLKSTIK
jgi:putative phage-type endonuclease